MQSWHFTFALTDIHSKHDFIMRRWDLKFSLKHFYSREAEFSFEHFSSFLIIHGSINILQPDIDALL